VCLFELCLPGGGEFGEVYKAKWHGSYVAAKKAGQDLGAPCANAIVSPLPWPPESLPKHLSVPPVLMYTFSNMSRAPWYVCSSNKQHKRGHTFR
jgi:hypothetical protein